MEVTGRIINGTIVPDQKIDWPEDTPVRITASDERGASPPDRADVDPAASEDAGGPTLRESLADWIGSLDLPPDFSVNHDHYIHGSPKKTS